VKRGKIGRDVTADDEAEGSIRTCIVTRAKLPPEELMRFVLGPGDVVTPDLRRKLPGRGVWVQATALAVAEAVKRKAFARGFKAPAIASPALADEVDVLLARDALQSLAMANKAGMVASGAFKVEGDIARNLPAAIVEASDGSPDGARKIFAALLRRWGDEAKETPRVELFASSQLDLALGRTNVIHAALRKGAASDAFLARCRRLARYRSGGMAQGPAFERSEACDEPQGSGGYDGQDMGSESAPGHGEADHGSASDISTSKGTAPGS
jgi:predicted RNA-binding protein YlxR (DUF448 family)